MDKPTEPAGTSKRRRRWPFIIVGIIVLIPLVLVAMAPLLLSTPAGNRLIGSRLDKLFAPGKLHFDSIEFSWTSPTRLKQVAIDDPTGNTVVWATAATLSPSLWGLIVRPHELGTLALDHATIIVTQRRDGSIDLAEALKGIFEGRDPLRDLTIRADAAVVSATSPFLGMDKGNASLDLDVRLRPTPKWSTWAIKVANGVGNSLEISGGIDRWGTSSRVADQPDLNVSINANHWRVGYSNGSQTFGVGAFWVGKCEAKREGGNWRLEGNVEAEKFGIGAKPLRESLNSPLVKASWAVERSEGKWKIDRLDAKCNLGSISTEGGASDRIVGELDLAEIANQIPFSLGFRYHEPLDRNLYASGGMSSMMSLSRERERLRIEKGKARLVVQPSNAEGRAGWAVEASLADLVARSGEQTLVYRDPATLSALVVPGDQGLTLDRLDLKTPFLDATVRGDVERGWELDGSLDLAALQRQFADLVDLRGVQLGGRSRLRGSSHYVGSSLEGMLGIDLAEVDCFGMKLDATPLVFRTKENRLTIDPIETKLNGGRLHVEPQLDLEARDGPVMRLGKESTLDGALVNEEVSSRVLSYVAPVLNQTTHASGRVSVAIDRAEFPLAGAPGRKANVTGKVVFQDLEFAPSPMIRMLLSAVSTEEPRSLRLDEPVLLSIADGRVNQRGLAIPIAGLTKVEIEGWVDFDRNMNLVATLPFTRELFGGQTVASNLLAGARVKLLITGTLGNPKIDKETLRKNIGEVRDTLLTNVAGNGAAEILRLLTKPRDPNAPPPPTAEERKAKRLEMRNERRKARGLDPLPGPPAKP
jgi:hypothetical protein